MARCLGAHDERDNGHGLSAFSSKPAQVSLHIMMPNIAFIGFGEAAQRFAETLKERGVARFTAFDIKLLREDADARAIQDAAAHLGVDLVSDAETAVQGADWVFSAVIAPACLDAALSVVGALQSGQIFIDINSVSARAKQNAAAVIVKSGASYIDMAVMAPVLAKGHATPTLVAGPDDAQFLSQLESLSFNFEYIDQNIGSATSIKLTRSLFVKGLEALTLQALLAARQSGCYDRVLASLSKSFDGLGWPDFASYELERIARHGVRRGAEMHECAVMLADNGFGEGAALADAIANFQDEIGALGFSPDKDVTLDAQLDALLRVRGQGS